MVAVSMVLKSCVLQKKSFAKNSQGKKQSHKCLTEGQSGTAFSPKLNRQLFIVVCHHAQALCFTQRSVIASFQHDVDHFEYNESHIQTV